MVVHWAVRLWTLAAAKYRLRNSEIKRFVHHWSTGTRLWVWRVGLFISDGDISESATCCCGRRHQLISKLSIRRLLRSVYSPNLISAVFIGLLHAHALRPLNYHYRRFHHRKICI